MSQHTSIEWTDCTWNPTRGCSRVSEGCRNCYAEKIAGRFSKGDLDNHNNGDQPFHGFAVLTPSGPRWTGNVGLIEEKLSEPLHRRNPRRVFVNSMSDLFHEALSDEAIDRVFAVMALCPQHTFQVLTKRAARMLDWARLPRPRHRESTWWEEWRCLVRSEKHLAHAPSLPAWPLPNVWLGVSVEDQKTADERIPLLLQTPAAVRFVSYEPALGPVNFRSFFRGRMGSNIGLDWIIVGGETGPGARPFDVQWARTTIEQCKSAGVACFAKQLGANPIHPIRSVRLKLSDPKGGNWGEWPADLRVREFPK